MANTSVTLDQARSSAKALLETVDISRIVVVDDEYADHVEELIGLCSVIGSAVGDLPHLDWIDFSAPEGVWTDEVRTAWRKMDRPARRETTLAARRLEASMGSSSADLEAAEPEQTGDVEAVDKQAANVLAQLLTALQNCEFLTLSLVEWRDRRNDLLAEDKAATTLVLFDQDFGREEDGTKEEGIRLIREVHSKDVGYYGLLTHTVLEDNEYEVWNGLADKHQLQRDRFLVISKARLMKDMPDYYGFLAMVRLAALSGRYAEVKKEAWEVFKGSLEKAESAMEKLSVLDFDQAVFESSRREGVWEPDTLFRVFGILMHREARLSLHADKMSLAVTAARRVSAAKKQIITALGEQPRSKEVLQMQRFEMYEPGEDLNCFHTPVDLGDVFRTDAGGRSYLLLGQSCDLMVRSKGKRNHEDSRLGLTATVVEIFDSHGEKPAARGELPFYNVDTGASAWANFAKVHQVWLAVLDLCVLCEDGSATIDVTGDCSDLLIETWQKRFPKLRRRFKEALHTHQKLAETASEPEMARLALPSPSSTLQIAAAIDGTALRYGIRRTMRLRQPWSGALLSEFTQHRARTAFPHTFFPLASTPP